MNLHGQNLAAQLAVVGMRVGTSMLLSWGSSALIPQG